MKLSEQQTIDPKTERLKLANEENLRLQNELHEMHKKFDTLNNRIYLYFILIEKS